MTSRDNNECRAGMDKQEQANNALHAKHTLCCINNCIRASLYCKIMSSIELNYELQFH